MLRFLPEGYLFRLREALSQMGMRVTLFAVAGVALALMTAFLAPYIPFDAPIEPAAGSVDAILNVLAGAMLPVATFSVSIIATAYGTATNNATPRASRLLSADPIAQTAVSVFIGAFMFAIAGIIGIAAGAYSGSGRNILFLATLLVIGAIAWALLRWVDHLSNYGSINDIVARVEARATEAAALYRDLPALGAQPAPRGALPDGAILLRSMGSGYVQHIDMERLNEVAGEAGLRVEVLRMTGKYVHHGEPILRLSAPCDEETGARLRNVFTIDAQRSFDQDLRYGLIVLSEIGGRALAPGANDVGTAIEVLRAGTRALMVLHGVGRDEDAPDPHPYAHVSAPVLSVDETYAEFFAPLARSGAERVEVIKTLLDGTQALAQAGGGLAARQQARDAYGRAMGALTQEWEKELLRQEMG
ncbi:MAG: DUF2254 domain-containing protein [Paracoccus sp. (in: a-proteobacteria)]|nr:DUF2254 domain-containing protein [Paracoccus sp. (in: a-proteobacteria)]